METYHNSFIIWPFWFSCQSFCECYSQKANFIHGLVCFQKILHGKIYKKPSTSASSHWVGILISQGMFILKFKIQNEATQTGSLMFKGNFFTKIICILNQEEKFMAPASDHRQELEKMQLVNIGSAQKGSLLEPLKTASKKILLSSNLILHRS